jgi:hypothetical protein
MIRMAGWWWEDYILRFLRDIGEGGKTRASKARYGYRFVQAIDPRTV